MNNFLEFIQNNFFQAYKYSYCYCTIVANQPAKQMMIYMQGYLMYDLPDDHNVPWHCEGRLESYRSDYSLNFRVSSAIENDTGLYSLIELPYRLFFHLERQESNQLIARFTWENYLGKHSNNIQITEYNSGVLYGLGKLDILDNDECDDDLIYLINIGKPQPLNQDIFQQQKHPKFGKINPEKMDFEFWKYMVKTKSSAYIAKKTFGESGKLVDSPVWCFDRFGVSKTELFDGRIICISGEHEDYYDPDFYIYNDVIVIHPNREITIYGYPKEVFPPTDFHSTTLIDQVEEFIYIIGCLGYIQDRKPGNTPVYLLNCETFAIEKIETTGENPGWIYKHEAEFLEAENCIKIEQGIIFELEEGKEVYRDNTEVYYLNLGNYQWYRRVME